MNKLAFLAVSVAFTLPALAAAPAGVHQGGEVMFVSGQAQRLKGDGTRVAVAKGMQVAEGDRIRTEPDSHVYVRLRDGGLLVVRPGSELVIERWRYDAARPEDSQIKYMLEQGVARHVSGKAAKAARDKFRFNTPLAAIGVRGTDFTVLADEAVTRVAVRSGGVVVSGLGNGCRADALGPCEGESAVELFANTSDRLLQLRQGERRPELIERDKRDAPAPDAVNPPAVVEPVAKLRSGDTDELNESRTTEAVSKAAQVQATLDTPPAGNTGGPVDAGGPGGSSEPPPPEPFRAAAWGRFKAIAQGDPGVVSIHQVLAGGHQSRGLNDYYILAAPSGKHPELPGSGSATLRLLGHDGVLHDAKTGKAVATEATDGRLNIDFGSRRFDTTLSIRAPEAGFAATVEGAGTIERDGSFMHGRQHSNATTIQGLVGEGGNEAAYIYDKRVGDLKASGAALWRK